MVILRDRTTTDLGYVSTADRSELIGQHGLTITGLRPSGIIDLNNERIDVVSDGSFIDKDEEVEIIKVEGMRVVVKKVNQQTGGD